MIRYALLATLIAVATTLCIVAFLEKFGNTVSIISATITALIVTLVWHQFKKRQPTFHEKTILIVVYWVLTATVILGPAFLVNEQPLALAIMFIYTIPYPAMMLMVITIKYLSDEKKEKLKDWVLKIVITGMIMAALSLIFRTHYQAFFKISEIINQS